MNICTVYTNCQGAGVAQFLKKTGFPFEMQVFENYRIILKELDVQDLNRSARQCALFIVQPTSEEKHGELSSVHFIEKVIPKDAAVIRMPSIVCDCQHPIHTSGTTFFGYQEIRDYLRSTPLSEVLVTYDQGETDFHLRSRFNACIADLAARENRNGCNVRMSDFMMSHIRDRLMLTYNHPTSIIMAEMARQVRAITLGKDEPIPFSGENDCNLPCSGPVSSYVAKEFGWERTPDPGAHEFYREILCLFHSEANKEDPCPKKQP